MKKIFFIVALTVATIVSSYAQGIEFFKGSYQEAQDQATKDGKGIIIDFFTNSCAPCKLMERDVFPLKVMGDYINSRYIFVKFDAQSSKNEELVKQFKLVGYPTYVVLDSKGQEQDRLTGSCSAEAFIARLDGVSDKSLSLEAFEKRYVAGERDKAFLLGYITILSSADRKKTAKVAEVLFADLSPAEKCSEKYWFLIDNYLKPNNPFEIFLIQNRKSFEDLLGVQKVNEKLKQNCLKEYFDLYFGLNGEPTQKQFDKLNNKATKMGLENDPDVRVQRAITDAVVNGKIDQFLTIFEQNQSSLNDAVELVKVVTATFSNKFTIRQRDRFKQLVTDPISKTHVDQMLVENK